MSLNIPLIRRVKQWILTHPDEYNQEECTRCIGGLAYYLGRNIPPREWKNYVVHFSGKNGAEGLLGLPAHYHIPGSLPLLFVTFPDLYWPEPFASQWEKARTRRERARIADRRLDYLLKTGR